MNPTHLRLAATACALLCAVFAPTQALAQAAPSPSSPSSPASTASSSSTAPAEDEAVTLNTFEVTADANDSYEALNTASVTGTNRSIRSLPVTMNPYTRPRHRRRRRQHRHQARHGGHVAIEGTLTSRLSARIGWSYQDTDNFYETGTTDLLAPT